MSRRSTAMGWRRLLPQTVRVRLTLLYAALFLSAGVVLLGLTYGLVASSLPVHANQAKLNPKLGKELELCKEQPSRTGKAPRQVSDECRRVFAAGARAGSTSQRDRTLHELLLYSLLGLGLVTLASGGLGYLMAGRVLRPVRAITDAARRASEQRFGERLALEGPNDEMKILADTFDDMLDRLDTAFASQKRFVADASHELRTPLTVMRTSIDVTLAKPSRSPAQLEEMAAKVRRAVDQADKLIDALLTLAVSEQDPIETEPVDLATMAEDALDTAAADVSKRHLRIDMSLESAPTCGDQLLLERLVGNLVDNAVRHNIDGGWIEVRTGRNGAQAFVAVVNSGASIPEEGVQSLFEPFRKGGERTTDAKSIGLGLAIVRSIATAHGGSIEACSPRDGGLSVTVLLPESEEARALDAELLL